MNFDSGENDDFLTLKMQGNTYMQDKQYLKAVKRYTGALTKLPPIEKSSQEDIKNRLITLSNRAEGFLKLGYFYSSLKDCEEILTNNKQHLSLLDTTQKDKIIYRKGRSKEQLASSLEDLNKIYDIYEQMSEESKKKFNIETIKEGLNEKKNNMQGKYNKKELLSYEKSCIEIINGKKYYLDSLNKEFKNTNFFNNDLIEENYNNLKGIHYLAKQDINEGTLLIVELPIISIYEAEIKKFSSTFEKFKKMGFTSNELAIEILFTIFKDRIEFEEEKNNLINKISQLSCLSLKNSNLNREERIKNFKYNDDDIKDLISNNAILTIRNERKKIVPTELCYGLYINSSFFNHSCEPNCFYFGIANMLIVKAIKNIKKGEELTVSYIEPKPMALRKNELLKWDFTCDCKYCKQEAEICDKDEYFNIFETYIKIQNIMVTHGIDSFEQLEIKFSVDLQDDIYIMIQKLIEDKKFNWNEDKLKFLYFMFFKCVAVVMGHIEKQKNFSNYLFEKAYNCVKYISKREKYELISNWMALCDEQIFKLKKIELEQEINEIYDLLYSF